MFRYQNLLQQVTAMRSEGKKLGWLVGMIGFTWFTGGYPLRAWPLFLQVLPRLTELWRERGASAGLAIAGLGLIAVAGVVAWTLAVWGCVEMIASRSANRGRPQFVRVGWEPSVKVNNRERILEPIDQIKTRPERQTRDLTELEPVERLGVQAGVGWDTGIVRRYHPNEDSLTTLHGTCTYNGSLQFFGLFVVADGMGGHAHGREASRMAIQGIMQSVLVYIPAAPDLNESRLVEILLYGAQQANRFLYRRAQELNVEMGTTLTAALVVDNTAYIINVGDSRTYLYRPSEGLEQITKDHSYVAQLVEEGKIGKEDIYTHPDRNQVYRGLGGQESVEIDWFSVPLELDDYLILCSDGLWEMVRDREIERILRLSGSDPTRTCNALVGAALRSGGVDNISVIAVQAIPASPHRVGQVQGKR